MPYSPDATDVLNPIDGTVKAATAAAEFRTIKLYMRDVLLAGLTSKASLAGATFTGAIGVGAAPAGAYRLTVDSAASDNIAYFRGNNFSGQVLKLDAYSGNLRLESSVALALGAAGNEWVRVTTSGNVGVGTTTPLARFDSAVLDAGTNNVPVSVQLTHAGSGVPVAGYGSCLQYVLRDAGGSLISTNSISSVWADPAVGVRATALVFYRGLGNVQSEAMRIDSAGNVSVGNAAPIGNLHVGFTRAYNASADASIALGGLDNGYVNNGATSAWRQYVAGDANGQALRFDGFVRAAGWTERVRIDSAGNVGVGLTAPTNTLHARGSFRVDTNGATDSVALSSGGAGLAYFGSTTATALALLTNGTERLRVKTSGGVVFVPMGAPASPQEGEVYYDSTAKKHYGWNGTSWNAFY